MPHTYQHHHSSTPPHPIPHFASDHTKKFKKIIYIFIHFHWHLEKSVCVTFLRIHVSLPRKWMNKWAHFRSVSMSSNYHLMSDATPLSQVNKLELGLRQLRKTVERKLGKKEDPSIVKVLSEQFENPNFRKNFLSQILGRLWVGL